MNTAVKTLLAGLALTTLSATAFADGPTDAIGIDRSAAVKTRAEVRAELAQAMAQNRVGLSEAEEQRLAFADFVPTKTRAQVVAETREAIAQGRVARNEADEQRLAFADFVPTKTRAQVVAETREAMRLGLIARSNHEANNNPPTAEQLRRVADAGLRANAGGTVSQ
jgi:hypothetical protein